MHTCIQIEVWNYLAGGKVLPNREGGKLRYAMGETEAEWRKLQSFNSQDFSLRSGRPLTEKELALFKEYSKKARRHNKVVSWSRGMGMLQYVLAPIALIWSLAGLIYFKSNKMKILTCFLLLSNFICLVVMFYRGYFND